MKILILFPLLLLSLAACSQSKTTEKVKEEAAAEEINKEMQLPEEYVKDKVVIFNSSRKAKTFFLGESSESLQKIKLQGQKSHISYSYEVKPVFVIYTSKDVFVRYKLDLGSEYKIYYNPNTEKWDLKKIEFLE